MKFKNNKFIRKNKIIIISIVGVVILALLVFAGTKFYEHKQIEKFGTSYNQMNDDYKKVLFATGQDDIGSSNLLTNYENSWKQFYDAYLYNPIEPYKSDLLWDSTLNEMQDYTSQARIYVDEGKLHEAHLKLEKIRQKWQEIFERNGVSELSFKMTAFHDMMEIAIDQTNEEKYSELSQTCVSLNLFINDVVAFSLNENEDLQMMAKKEQSNVNTFCEAVNTNDIYKIKSSVGDLKPDFIKMYLKYG